MAEKKSSSKKKSDPGAEMQKAPGPIDDTTARSDDDALFGHFAEVVSGDEKGLYGVVIGQTDYDDNGYPQKAILESRDDDARRVVVDYSDLRRAEAGRR